MWQVLDGGKPVTGGTGQQGATGILDTGSGGHRLYSIEFKAGPAMAPVIRAKPLLEIVRVSAIRQ